MAAAGAGQALVFMPDANKAKAAAVEFFEVFDWRNKIHPNDSDVQLPSSFTEEGKSTELVESVEFREVYFRYPSRPGVSVLRGLSFRIDCVGAKSVAFVGSSGGGKSSVMSLLQRFYDVETGQILLNGKDIKSFNVFYLRRLLAVVSQEPTLFDLSLRSNLLYGVSNESSISSQAINLALTTSGVDFVPSNLTLEDRVGAKGSLLSGGQKQRVAIARALLKRSPVMIYDEATSALDSVSERLVQQAIEAINKEKTSFVIAHRLSSIKNSDLILVISQGRLVQAGTHSQLMGGSDDDNQQQPNLYAQLYNQGM
jgi:ATP-binding cassette subfamily B (MDR/TAP) protein 1